MLYSFTICSSSLFTQLCPWSGLLDLRPFCTFKHLGCQRGRGGLAICVFSIFHLKTYFSRFVAEHPRENLLSLVFLLLSLLGYRTNCFRGNVVDWWLCFFGWFICDWDENWSDVRGVARDAVAVVKVWRRAQVFEIYFSWIFLAFTAFWIINHKMIKLDNQSKKLNFTLFYQYH